MNATTIQASTEGLATTNKRLPAGQSSGLLYDLTCEVRPSCSVVLKQDLVARGVQYSAAMCCDEGYSSTRLYGLDLAYREVLLH